MYYKNLFLSTPATLKTVVTPKDFYNGNDVNLHPAKYATSASPEQSIILYPYIACLPDLLYTMIPLILPFFTIASTT